MLFGWNLYENIVCSTVVCWSFLGIIFISYRIVFRRKFLRENCLTLSWQQISQVSCSSCTCKQFWECRVGFLLSFRTVDIELLELLSSTIFGRNYSSSPYFSLSCLLNLQKIVWKTNVICTLHQVAIIVSNSIESIFVEFSLPNLLH